MPSGCSGWLHSLWQELRWSRWLSSGWIEIELWGHLSLPLTHRKVISTKCCWIRGQIQIHLNSSPKSWINYYISKKNSENVNIVMHSQSYVYCKNVSSLSSPWKLWSDDTTTVWMWWTFRCWVLKSDLDAKLVFWRSPMSVVLECRNIKQILRWASDAHPVHNHYFHGLRCLFSKKQKRFAQYFI